MRAGLAREAAALARIEHVNVVRFHEAVIEDDVVCLVLEMVEGVTLAPVRLPDDLQAAQNQFNVNTQLDAAQQAQNTRTLSEADGLKPLIDKLGVEGALQYILNKAIADGKVPSPVIINGNAPIAVPR